MIAIASRSGIGQEFELEFSGYMPDVDVVLNIPESKTFRSSKYMAGGICAETCLRWTEFGGEQRLMIDMGEIRTPFDEAALSLRNVLRPWVERFATMLRKGRYSSE